MIGNAADQQCWTFPFFQNPRLVSEEIGPGWIGHARNASTYRLRTDLFRRMMFQRVGANPSSAPRRGR